MVGFELTTSRVLRHTCVLYRCATTTAQEATFSNSIALHSEFADLC